MRYAAAAVCAAVVTSVQLAFRHQRSPLGRRRWRALGWWMLLIAIDAVVGIVAVKLASETGHHSAGDFAGWITIGVLAPLGLRSPVWRKRLIANREVEPGLTVVYDATRTWCAVGLDDQMGEIRRRHRDHRVQQVVGQGWHDGEILAAIEGHLDQFKDTPAAEVRRIRETAYLALTGDDDTHVTGLVQALISSRLTALLKRMCTEPPNDDCKRAAPAALARAHEFLQRVAQVGEAQDEATKIAEAPPVIDGGSP
jgi:hypothetical protein